MSDYVPVTRVSVLREFHRLCELVKKTYVDTDLLDADEVQPMCDRFRERADVVLEALKPRDTGRRRVRL